MATKAHRLAAVPFSTRAENPSSPCLSTYLLSLMSIKRSNLCLSADVHTTYDLLNVAEEVGDYICVLKTHADIIDDFSDKTVRGLQEISARKQFLLFEDRKLGDIGNTVQSQYTRGPLAIATWAHLTNAHLLPGPAIVPSLHSAAEQTLISLNQSMKTIITTGTPRTSLDSPRDSTQPSDPTSASTPNTHSKANEEASPSTSIPSPATSTPQPMFEHTRRKGRAGAMATATTTISQTFEPTSPRHPTSLIRALSIGEGDPKDKSSALEELGPPPHARGLLLLAQMSSEGNLLTPEYTDACISTARSNKDFVIGFVAQQSLNQQSEDAFLNFAPGISLPPEGEEEGGVRGDGKGQKWRAPEEVVKKDGIDVVIVGRGILGADDRAREAERYRKAAWEAYEGRIGRR